MIFFIKIVFVYIVKPLFMHIKTWSNYVHTKNQKKDFIDFIVIIREVLEY